MRKICFFVSALFLPIMLLSLQVFAAETVIYSEGFESSNGGYTVDGNALWQWGTPSNVGPSSCNSGLKCLGTNLSGVINNVDGSVISPAISIPSLSPGQQARIRFYAYIQMGNMTDRGEFFVSSNGVTWESLAELFLTMAGGWQKYEFDISNYAGGNIYLRFRVHEDQNANVPGLYIDDVAITVYSGVGSFKTLTLEAWENASASASCPWVFTWDGTEYVMDNDIYSVARYAGNEYTDYYLLQKSLVAQNGNYSLEIREAASEDSRTDKVGLIAVDHAEDVAIGPNERGNIFAYKPGELIAPVSAISNSGNDVRTMVSAKDNSGFPAYSGDYLEIDFGRVDISRGARIILRVKGFNLGEGEEKPYIGPPAIVVQALDGNNVWREVGRLYPRFQWAEGVYDLTPYLPNINKIRLYSISHGKKYNEIDYVALSIGPEPFIEINGLDLVSANFRGSDVSQILEESDNNYVSMGPGDKFSVSFAVKAQTLPKRDFIFISEGYYIPKSATFFIYTWDGANWVQRGGYSFPGNDFTKTFDLSLFLPDPAGEYKVRIWQDYGYEDAGIDFVGLQVGATTGTLDYATDLRNSGDIKSLVQSSDDNRFNYAYGNSPYPRNRWTEYKWSGFPSNVPPSTNPVTVSGNTINWVYTDAENDPETGYEVEIWTGPGGTGTIVWDPLDFSGSQTSVSFAPGLLTPNVTYYARVKAFDGSNWGQWSETRFIAEQELQPSVTIPTLTEWGMMILMLLLGASAMCFMKKRSHA